MTKSKNILIPVDYSDCSINALNYAINIAHSNDSKLTILNIEGNVPIEKDSARKLVKNQKIELINKEILLNNISHEFVVSQGNVIKEILKFQNRNKSDLIVMGTQGASNLNKKLFGSNTTGVIEKADCPVLTVPEGYLYKGFKKVVLATDKQNENLKMMELAIDSIRSFNPELMLLYVSSSSDPTVESINSLSEIPADIKKHINYSDTTMYVSTYKDISLGIEDFINKKKADLLIMITKHRSVMQSFTNASQTKKMAINSRVPLLAVPNLY